jgi:ABC-type transport system involved in multi-copper enzyme maturation permease subunit
MRSTLTLIRREFAAYFWSPVAYVVLGVFLLATGLLFHLTLQKLTARGPAGTEFPMQDLIGNVGFWLIFWIIPPLLTMRLFAEERSTGTLEMLMTAPLRDGQVVFCKFVACYLFYALLLLPTLIYLPLLLDMHGGPAMAAYLHSPWIQAALIGVGVSLFGLFLSIFRGRCGLITFFCGLTVILVGIIGASVRQSEIWSNGWPHLWTGVDPMPVVTTYLGLALSGAMFLALGLWVSSLVRNQLVAALVALALNLVFLLGGLLVLGGFLAPPSDTAEPWYRLVTFFSVPLHFNRDFTRGLVDSRNVVLYVSVAIVGLFLTVRGLESRRWK